jgi:tRNA(Ile)-lysidine synthase
LDLFVREQRVRFREDASNSSTDHQRNLIRHELLPLLRARFQPALDKVIQRAMDIVGADAEVVIASAQAALKAKPRQLSEWPVGIQRRLLYDQLQKQGIAADFDLVESLRQKPDCAVSIGPSQTVERDRWGKLHLLEAPKAHFTSSSVTIHLGQQPTEAAVGGVHFRWRLGKQPKTLVAQSGCERFDASKIGSTITLRHWKAGDRFQPIGMAKSVKLQDWFTNRKVPRSVRHQLIVAATADKRIFWVEDQRIDERFKLTAATVKCLIWRWQRG